MQAKNEPLLDVNRANTESGPTVIAVYRHMVAGEVQPLHSHARGQAMAAESGLLKIDTENDRLVVPPGHAVWLPPHCPHRLASHGQFSGWSIYATPRVCPSLPQHPQVIQISGLMREAVMRAVTWSQKMELDAAQARVCDVIVDEIMVAPIEKLNLPFPTDRRLRKIALELEENPANNRSLEEWAAWAAIAPRTLTRRFATETGMPFSTWRQRARLIRALEMLAANIAVTTIAIDLGYDSLSAFIAMFKRTFGVTPAKYLARV